MICEGPFMRSLCFDRHSYHHVMRQPQFVRQTHFIEIFNKHYPFDTHASGFKSFGKQGHVRGYLLFHGTRGQCS